MALQKQVVSFPFRSGLDLKTSDKQVLPNKLLQITNGRFINTGRIDKAFGSAPLNANVQPTAGTGLWCGAFEDEFLFMEQVSGAWSQQTYSPANQGFRTTGAQISISPTWQVADASQLDHSVVETCYASGQPSGTGYIYTAFLTSQGLYVVVRDAGTNSIVLSPVLIDSAGTDFRFTVANNYVTLFYTRGAGSSSALFYAQFQNGALTTTTTNVGLASGVSSTTNSGNFECRVISDAGLISGSPYVAIAWIGKQSGDSSTVLNLAAWNPQSRTLGSGTNGLPAPQVIALVDATYLGTVGMWACTSPAPQTSLLIAVAQFANPVAYPTHQAIQFVWTDTQENIVQTAVAADSTTIGWGRMTCSGAPTEGGAYVQLVYEEGNLAVSGYPVPGSVPTLKCVEIAFRGTYRKNGGFLQAVPQRVGASIALHTDAWSANGSPTQLCLDNCSSITANQYHSDMAVTTLFSTDEQTFFIASLGALYGTEGTFQVQSKLMCQSAGGQSPTSRCATSTVLSNGSVLLSLTQQTNLGGEFEDAPQLVRCATTGVLSYGAQPTQASGVDSFYLGSGVLNAYDSDAFAEHNFHLFPEAPVVIGSPVAVTRTVAGKGSTTTTGASAEVTQITVPPPAFSPDGTKFGSGWQIQPGSYFTIFSQCDEGLAANSPLGASLGYAFYFVVDGLGYGNAYDNLAGAWIGFSGGSGGGGALPPLTKGQYSQLGGYTVPGWVYIAPIGIASTDDDVAICNAITQAVQNAPGAVIAPPFTAVTQGPSGAPPAPGAVVAQITSVLNVNAMGAGWAGAGAGGAGASGQGYITNPGLPSSWCDTFGCLPVQQLTAGHFALSMITCPMGNRLLPGGYFVWPSAVGAFPTPIHALWFQVDGQGTGPSGSSVPLPQEQPGNSSPTIPWSPPFLNQLTVTSAMTAYGVAGVIESTVNAIAHLLGGFYGFRSNGTATPAWLPANYALPPECGLLGYSSFLDTQYFLAYDVSSAGWAIEANQGGTSPGQGGIVTGLPPGNGTLSIWQYVVTYEFVDGRGQIHRSAPSEPGYCLVNGTAKGTISGVPTGGCTPRLLISPALLTLSQKRLVSIVVYRTLLNQSVFRRCSDDTSPLVLSTSVSSPVSYAQSIVLAPQTVAVSGGTLANWSSLVAPVPFVDTSGAPGSFASAQSGQTTSLDPVAANPAGYWQVGVELQSAPALSAIIWHRNRLFGISSENPSQLWFSQLYVPGAQTGVGFNPDLFIINLPEPATALGSMDDSLVVFSATRAYRISGSGPALNGQSIGDDFSPPLLVTTDVGCQVPNSVLMGPVGLVFQSQKGLQLLGRNWVVANGPEGFGRAVDGLVLGNTVLSVVMLPDRQELRFTLSSGDVLFYQYDFDSWSRRTGWNGAAACVYNSLYTWINPTTSTLWQETPNLYLDNGSPYAMTIQTPWYKLSGMQGYGRVWKMLFLGTFQSDHILQVQIAKDYSLNAQAVVYFNAIKALGSQAPGIYGGATYGASNPQDLVDGMAYEFQAWIPAGLQLAEAIQFTITDIAQGVFDSGGALPYTLTVYGPGPDSLSQSIPLLFQSSTQGQNTNGQGEPYQSYSIESLSLELGIIPGAKRFGPARQTG